MNKRHFLFNKQAINELRSRAQEKKPGFLYESITRKYSFVFSALLAKVGLTPNIITLFMILSGVLGSILFLSQTVLNSLLGIFFFNLWFIFDCSDGEVARITGKSSVYGSYLDRIAHWVTHPLMILSISYHYFLGCEDAFLYLVLGGLYIAANFVDRDYGYLVNSCLNYNVYREIDIREKEGGLKGKIKSLNGWYCKYLHVFPNFIAYFSILYIMDLLIHTMVFRYSIAGLFVIGFFILGITRSYVKVSYNSYMLWMHSR